MTNTEKVLYHKIIKSVVYYQENKFDKYVILEFVDGMINQVRRSDLCTDELLSHLFDVRQKVVLGKEVKIGG